MGKCEGRLNPPPKRIIYTGEALSLVIRPLEEGDAECLVRAVKNSGEILKPFLDWAHQDWTIEQQIERLRKSSANYYLGKEYELGVFSPAEFLMSASWTPETTQNRKALEVGYWTHIDHCGKGLATLVSQILVVTAFEVMGADRVGASCKKGNIASLKVIERCGFRFEGEVRNYFDPPTKRMLENGFHPERNCLQYALTPEDVNNLHWYSQIRKKLSFIPSD